MKIVSKLLGNTGIAITEDSYGKVVKKKVSEQKSGLIGRLKIEKGGYND